MTTTIGFDNSGWLITNRGTVTLTQSTSVPSEVEMVIVRKRGWWPFRQTDTIRIMLSKEQAFALAGEILP